MASGNRKKETAIPNYYVGYDPGGRGKFGAAALREAGGSLTLTASEIVASVSGAVEFARGLGRSPVAAAIDAPLTWPTGPDRFRQVDRKLRSWYPSHKNRVMAPNSLMGSVVVQGPALAMALTERFPSIVISEAHPKLTCVALGLLGIPAHQIFGRLGIEGTPSWNDDLLDAVVAAYVAWAAHNEAPGWANLLRQIDDRDLLYPLGETRSVYYFPLREYPD